MLPKERLYQNERTVEFWVTYFSPLYYSQASSFELSKIVSNSQTRKPLDATKRKPTMAKFKSWCYSLKCRGECYRMRQKTGRTTSLTQTFYLGEFLTEEKINLRTYKIKSMAETLIVGGGTLHV